MRGEGKRRKGKEVSFSPRTLAPLSFFGLALIFARTKHRTARKRLLRRLLALLLPPFMMLMLGAYYNDYVGKI